MVSQSVATAGRQARLAGGLRALVRTDGGATPAIARVALGLVMLPHGAQKLLGWFGGYGFSATMGWFADVGVPGSLAFLAIMSESFGALALVLGIFGRVAAFGILSVMVGAAATVHLPNGFFMNWFGNQAGEGYEYHVIAAALAAVVIVAGSGAGSIDRWIARRLA